MKLLLTAFLVLFSFSLSAQTLFYYGNDSVSVKDFLKAYQKNNTGPKTEKGLRDYLHLYIASRLKIKEARQMGLDTLPQMISDLENLRQQILPGYLNDKETINNLVNEAFLRSQKDIHLAHIFISTKQGTAEHLKEAKKKADSLVAALSKSKKDTSSFAALAKKYSEDPSARTNGGDLGWITVFNLPYELENLAYSTPVGKTSTLYQSKAGYHIFKNLGERKDPGKIEAAQILLSFPVGSDEQTKQRVKLLADSIYNRLLKGDDFGKLAAQLSNDVVSAAANGNMQKFGIGEYDPVFENAVLALSQDGSYSKPFLTSHGYHIVKRIGIKPITKDRNDAKAMQDLRDQVEKSDRMTINRLALAQRILKEVKFKRSAFDEAELYIYSDSILNSKHVHRKLNLDNNSELFQLGDKTVKISDWISYAQTFRYKSDGTGIKPYPQIWNEFINATALNYYQDHLEDYNEEFHYQITEFNEGNLFFEIMQQEIWGPAQTDSVALLDFYNRNKSKYNWNQSAAAVIFYATDLASAKAFDDQLKKSPASWHELAAKFGEKIAADSSRFELDQIPNPSKKLLKTGVITSPLVNKSDNTASFAYIIRTYATSEPRSFADARGLVINDYQAELEKSWVAKLQKKYPVRINQNEVGELVRGKK